jgi:hypothetical protein
MQSFYLNHGPIKYPVTLKVIRSIEDTNNTTKHYKEKVLWVPVFFFDSSVYIIPIISYEFFDCFRFFLKFPKNQKINNCDKVFRVSKPENVTPKTIYQIRTSRLDPVKLFEILLMQLL